MPLDTPIEELPDAPAEVRRADVKAGPAPARAWVGADAGAAVPLGPAGIGAQAHVELGARLPQWGGRVAPLVSAGYAFLPARGEVTDAVTGQVWGYTLHSHQITVGSGFTVRAKEASAKRSAELLLTPELILDRQVERTSGGSWATDGGLRYGGTVAVGVTGRTAKGDEWVLRAGARFIGFDGPLTGEHPLALLVLTGGYRHGL